MTVSVSPKVIEVLLVEDNIGDVRLTQEALKEGRLLVNLTVARDGIEAMDILLQKTLTPARSALIWSCSISICRAKTAAKCCGK